MLKLAFSMTLAIAAGISLVVQQAPNANLRVGLASTAWSGFMSYLFGVVCIAALALLLQEAPPTIAAASRISWFAWSGGLFGAIFIGLGIFLVPKLGAATFFALLFAGQMLGSIAFDHFGLLGVPIHEVSAIRVAGAAMLVGGVVLVRM
ncbi:DMT family transporter [Bradyrhizobium sp. BR 1432]|uniref:DMT family transporter n=1 Tax=Bradyrhizobium sp. BR 1432 TaxID=3447966 RepID=UPI003EE7ED36